MVVESAQCLEPITAAFRLTIFSQASQISQGNSPIGFLQRRQNRRECNNENCGKTNGAMARFLRMAMAQIRANVQI
jgi:hypothetical protein